MQYKHLRCSLVYYVVCMCRPVGRPHSKAWILKVVGQMWADKVAQDIADPAQNAGKTVSIVLMVLVLATPTRDSSLFTLLISPRVCEYCSLLVLPVLMSV